MAGAQKVAVQEASGHDLPPTQAAAVIAFGMISLLVIGVGPALLGALVDEHRITPAGLGITAMLELFGMGISTGLAGVFLKPERMKAIGAGASLILAAINVGTFHAHGMSVFMIRAAAGIPEGLLLWITVGMIARSVTPERWAAVFFTARVGSELTLALLYAFLIIPHSGADGGYAVMGLICLFGLPAALFAPDKYGPLVQAEGVTGALPLRGLIALAATVIFVSANGAVAVYLQPIAHRAGLSSDVARTAIWASLAAQILGGALSTILAGRVRYLPVFAATVASFLLVWLVFGLYPPALVFIAANCLSGIVALLIGPFLVPMIIDADPTRRSAMQSAGAQVFGGAIGPLLAALVVGNRDVHGVLWMGVTLMLIGFAVIVWLHMTNDKATAARAEQAGATES